MKAGGKSREHTGELGNGAVKTAPPVPLPSRAFTQFLPPPPSLPHTPSTTPTKKFTCVFFWGPVYAGQALVFFSLSHTSSAPYQQANRVVCAHTWCWVGYEGRISNHELQKTTPHYRKCSSDCDSWPVHRLRRQCRRVSAHSGKGFHCGDETAQ